MDPVVYDFAINENGTTAKLLQDQDALLPISYYQQIIPGLLRREKSDLNEREQRDLNQFTRAAQSHPDFAAAMPSLFDQSQTSAESKHDISNLESLLKENGFDRAQHEQIRAELKDGRIGLAHNRLPANTTITDIEPGDLFRAESSEKAADYRAIGEAALANGELAVVTYAAGVGSRWTQGAGVVKGLHPFAKLGGAHRSFIDVHLAKSRQAGRLHGATVPHVFTTSYLTHAPTENYLRGLAGESWERDIWVSPGRSIGLRLVPTVSDLHFAWQETAQQRLDEQQEKMRESSRAALTDWARSTGEASDYTNNLPGQCLHPVGHWFEIPNLLKNGTLARLLKSHPNLRTLMVHNIDTLGATADPAMLGWFNSTRSTLGWEAITKRIEDHGGGVARVNGRVRIIEGLALPKEEDEFRLTYYNANTCWVNIDGLLTVFGLTRADLTDQAKVNEAVRRVAARMPTYVTLKDVKKRWGHGQEDVFPVTQFEKLWGDMTGLADVTNAFALVPRQRGQQLKDQAQLDGWQRDGSSSHIASLCDW